MSTEFNIDSLCLYRSTRELIDRARETARFGKKDSAREILRFVVSARIIQNLKHIEWPEILQVDIAHLEWKLRELENDCHPSSVSDHRDDFAAIRSTCDALAVGMATLIAQSASKGKV